MSYEDELETAKDQLRDLIAHWKGKIGRYTETSAGVDGDTFTAINNRRAHSKVDWFTGMLDWVEGGNYLKRTTLEKIQEEYDRVF